MTHDDIERRMNDMYDHATGDRSLWKGLGDRWHRNDPNAVGNLWLFIVAFVGACQTIDTITAERDAARDELQKIGRKAFWASKAAG